MVILFIYLFIYKLALLPPIRELIKNFENVGWIMKAITAAVNCKSSNNTTPLHCSVSEDTTASMRWLIEHGAEIDTRDNKTCTPLFRFK